MKVVYILGGVLAVGALIFFTKPYWEPAPGPKKEQSEFEADSIQKISYVKRYLDTTGIAAAPVKVTRSWLSKDDSSKRFNIHLVYKNVSNKKVDGIRFEWYGVDSAGGPAQLGGGIDGTGKGSTDILLKPGDSAGMCWKIYSQDAKKITMSRASEVYFVDGTKWKFRK